MINPIDVVLKLEEHINARNAEAICALMTMDGEFIDSLGNRLSWDRQAAGRMGRLFQDGFRLFHLALRNFRLWNTVAIFGSAQGTFSKRW